ncbi:MAG TPA: hypothetical protein VFU11_13885 [Solirubrobacterales bacterium]|nr:hypothetical protein [Solirubrobacterales bacterium]
MPQTRSLRPSPSFVISLLALIVALGGTAYAAAKIGSKDIKKNAITAPKIKKNAITTVKIKNEAVTGAKIKESSLGAVPSAVNAETAANATNANNAANFSRFFASGMKKASIGQTVPLLTVGPFTITGKCADKGGGLTQATQWITTSQVGSSMYSFGDSSHYEANFNPNTELEIGYETYNNNPYIGWEGSGGYYTGFQAASGDGATLLEGDAVSGVLVYGAQCVFWNSATNVG